MLFNSGGIFTRNRGSLLSSPATLFMLLLSLTVSYAQKTRETMSDTIGNEQIQGRVFFPPGDKSSARPVVKLQSLSSPEVTAVTDQDGNFRFTHLRADEYTVIVEGGDQYEKATDTVSIGNSGPVPAQGDPGSSMIPITYQVQIYLRPKRSNTTTGQPALANKIFATVPAAARDLFQQALENARAGNALRAIEQLQSVIAQAPRFALAYNELAVQYLKTGRPAEAVDTLREALSISPEDFALRLNYGIALLNQKRFEAAETELRLATQNRNGDSPAARYYLGLALMSQQNFDGARLVFESVVKNGGDRLALAHRYLGGIYWRQKKYQAAADELEKYLKLEPKVADAEKIRGTIKELRHKS